MINLNDLIVIEPQGRSVKKLQVNVLESGKINLNGKFNREIGEREQEIRISKDGNILVMIPNGKHKQKFPKSGSLRNDKIIYILKKTKKKFPVQYTFEWNEEQQIWIGKTHRVGGNTVEK